MAKYLIYIPENLNLEQLISHTPPDFEFNLEFAYSFLFGIIKDTFRRTEKENWSEFKTNKPVTSYMLRRSSIILQNQMRNYNKYLDYLYNNNIIWRKPYSENVCRSFQLAPKYFGEKIKFITISDSRVFKTLKLTDEETGDFGCLNKWFNTRLQVDAESALRSLNEAHSEDLNWHKYILNCQKIIDLNNGKYGFSRKVFSDDRLHSAFTRFPKILRNYLTYDGKVIGEVDISASVPFFLYYHLLAIVDSSKINQIEYEKFFKTPRFYSNALNATKSKVKLNLEEVNNFGNTLLNGDFYEQFLPFVNDDYFHKYSEDVVGRKFNNSDQERRVIIKKNILAVINAKNCQHKETQEIFKTVFPTIMEFLIIFKSRRYLPQKTAKSKKLSTEKIAAAKLRAKERERAVQLSEQYKFNLKEKFQRHKKTAHLFLQTESFFMLNIIVTKLNKSKSKIPFLTLHDCIMTTEENVVELEQFMKTTFLSAIGVSPNFKTKFFK
jgi:hypothetical protein